MGFWAKFDLILRRLGVTLALAIVIDCCIAFANQDAAALLFIPSWLGLFFTWPYLSRKLNFNFPKPPAPKPTGPPAKRSTAWGRVIVTGVVAWAVEYAFGWLPLGALVVLVGPLTWIVLYHSWPAVSRRLPLPQSWRPWIAPETSASSPRRTFWRLVGRGALALVCAIFVLIMFPAMTVVVPIAQCERRAERVRESIHVGMSLEEVLHTARDCDVFGASSEAPYDEKNAAENIPAMGLTWRSDGSYVTYDQVAHADVSLTELQAIDRLHARLRDGYTWHFYYTYTNVTPMHVSFSVVFGPDGRVTEIRPVHGWD